MHIHLSGINYSEKGERSTYVSPDESFLITANTYSDEKGFAVSFKKKGKWQSRFSRHTLHSTSRPELKGSGSR